MNFLGRDILSTRDFSKEDVEQILKLAEDFLPYARKEKSSKLLDGKVLATLFCEPSTRTRLSFETAMVRLGGQVITMSGMESSSLVKGETLWDMAKVVENFADVIVLRHPAQGSAHEMARAAAVPVLNGGDGPGDHPTQALLDVFTILKEKGKLEGLTVAMVGDLKFGRTVHSLVYLLQHFKVKMVFVSPESLKMPADILEELKAKKVDFVEMENLSQGLKEADVVYMTRIQKERFESSAEYERVKDCCILDRTMVEKLNPEVTIMHPLPRVNEITTDVDALPGAAYFRQVQNGVAVRMALLAMVLGKV